MSLGREFPFWVTLLIKRTLFNPHQVGCLLGSSLVQKHVVPRILLAQKGQRMSIRLSQTYDVFILVLMLCIWWKSAHGFGYCVCTVRLLHHLWEKKTVFRCTLQVEKGCSRKLKNSFYVRSSFDSNLVPAEATIFSHFSGWSHLFSSLTQQLFLNRVWRRTNANFLCEAVDVVRWK